MAAEIDPNIDRLIAHLARTREFGRNWQALLAWLELPADASLQAVQNHIAIGGGCGSAVADDPSIEV